MVETLKTRDVLPMLAGRGLRVHRESLAEMSDLLGLRTRAARANWVQRSWYPAEVELIARAFELRQDWGFSLQVVQELVSEEGRCSERIMAGLRRDLEGFRNQIGVADSARAANEPQRATSTAA